MTDTDMLYMASLEKRNSELEAKVAELEDKHWNECRQIAHYDDELRKAKELLKAAVEDIEDGDCDYCTYNSDAECPAADIGCGFKWMHEAEALALIGDDANVPATANDIIVGRRLDGWISCEERLPEDNRPVLCYVRDITGEGSGYIIGSCEHSEFWFLKISGNKCFSFPYMRIKVTHWMPLPEPPKE